MSKRVNERINKQMDKRIKHQKHAIILRAFWLYGIIIQSFYEESI